MATVNSANFGNTESGIKRESRYTKAKMCVATDVESVLAAELDAADITLMDILLPSNAIIDSVAVFNADLDAHATPTLTIDIGLFAGQAFTKTVSGTATKVAALEVLDADALVDGSTVAQAATTSWTAQAFPSATLAAADGEQMLWEVLGYDFDPNTTFRVGVTMATAAATAAAGALGVRVKYLVD